MTSLPIHSVRAAKSWIAASTRSFPEKDTIMSSTSDSSFGSPTS